MLIIQGLALNQLFSPFYLWPPKINLPKEIDESEPLEYEINLAPGPMGPKAMVEPAESGAKPAESAAAAQVPSGAKSDLASTSPAVASPPSPEQSNPAQQIPEQPSPAEPSPAQSAAAVVSIAHSTPAPQPLLAVEATPAPSAPEIVLVPSVDVAAASTTEERAEERGAANGAPTSSDAVSTPVRPLALEPNAAPDRLAAAPISILPGVQAPKVEPVIAANPVTRADRAIDRIPVDLTIADEKPALEKPLLSQTAVPAPAVDVTLPMRVKPPNPKPDLSVEQAKPRVAKPVIPAAVVRPVLSRADASANPASTTTPDLRVDAHITPTIAAPAAPAAAVRPVLTRAPAKVGASESAQLEVARDEIGRPTLLVQAPIAATDSQVSDALPGDTPASDTPATDVRSADSAAAQSRDSAAAQSRDSERSAANAPNVGASTEQNPSMRSQNEGANALPSDPFAGAGAGLGPRDLLGQGRDAAAAQVGEKANDAYERRSAFRRYSDPFADDAPNPLAGLRLREPQMFSDVSRFLVKTFGPAALGFAVGASSEIDDFSGPNAGVLIEQWIQQHHGDLQRECRMRQETMDEHIRRLLCGEP